VPQGIFGARSPPRAVARRLGGDARGSNDGSKGACGGDGGSTARIERGRNEYHRNETKTIFPASIGRGTKQLGDRPITAGNIVFVSFSFRFRFVFVADFPSLCHTFTRQNPVARCDQMTLSIPDLCPCAIQSRPFGLPYGLLFTTQGPESRSDRLADYIVLVSNVGSNLSILGFVVFWKCEISRVITRDKFPAHTGSLGPSGISLGPFFLVSLTVDLLIRMKGDADGQVRCRAVYPCPCIKCACVDDNEGVVCESCDELPHLMCLNPVSAMTTP